MSVAAADLSTCPAWLPGGGCLVNWNHELAAWRKKSNQSVPADAALLNSALLYIGAAAALMALLITMMVNRQLAAKPAAIGPTHLSK